MKERIKKKGKERNEGGQKGRINNKRQVR